ncbi:amidohydrolase 2 [Byssothecium circinans]|uniref:Amidohydrolase 2 n=1 Tax=Byssothecium circinans TaxID=147558 RepID=A0A6A5TLC2_9PLEO|nr:amidohydrolase 2 [Byssothecium circinans]
MASLSQREAQNNNDITSRILTHATRDAIDLTVLPFLNEALLSIASISTNPLSTSHLPSFTNTTRIDTHTHPIPPWFRTLQPLAAGRETPTWDLSSHLNFMAQHSIKHSILCISTPQANAFPDDKAKTTALARLLNEFVAELVRCYPQRFSWMAVLPLPYVEEAVREARYAVEELGAVGVGVMTNHEGLYPGEERFDGLWGYLRGRAEKSGKKGREVVFVHPTDPVIRLDDGRLVSSKPSPLRSGLGEFYFETARAISSITAHRTIFKFPNLHWRISHGAGAFPDIADRFLLGFPGDAEAARKAYAKRFWYDSAGPVYPRQIKGLLAQGIPVSQFVFGTDYPYGIGFWDAGANIAGLAEADFLDEVEKDGVFTRNAEELWKGKIRTS